MAFDEAVQNGYEPELLTTEQFELALAYTEDRAV
jgi:hypothetical protein